MQKRLKNKGFSSICHYHRERNQLPFTQVSDFIDLACLVHNWRVVTEEVVFGHEIINGGLKYVF